MHFFKSPHLLLTITTLIWAGNAVAGKFAIGEISPMVLTLSRWAIALCIIGIIGQQHIRQDWPAIRKNWFYLLLMGGFGYTGFNYALYSALHHTSAINVMIEQSAMPLIIFVFNYILYRIAIGWLQIVGYLLTVIGVLVTATHGNPLTMITGGETAFNRGDAMMMLAGLMYAGYSVGLRSKPTMHWQSFLTALITGAVVFALVGVAYEAAMGTAVWPTSLTSASVALYTGIFPSLVSQGFFIVGVAAIGANKAGLYINLVPVFGAILSVMLLGEQLHLFHAVAFVLVVGGVLLAQRVSTSLKKKAVAG